MAPVKRKAKNSKNNIERLNAICFTCKISDSPLDKNFKNENWLHCFICEEDFHASCESVTACEYPDVKSTQYYFCTSCTKQSNLKNKSPVNLTLDAPTESARVMAEYLNENSIANLLRKQMELFWPQIESVVNGIVNGCMTSIHLEITRLSERISHLEKKLEELEDRDKISHLEKKIDGLEDRARSRNIIVRGIPDKISIEPIVIFKRIADVIGLQIDSRDITSARRLHNRTDQIVKQQKSIHSSAYILVSFSNVETKIQFLKRFFNFIKNKRIKVCDLINEPSNHDDSSGMEDLYVFVSDHLDKNSLGCFLHARKLKRDGTIHKWIIRRGRVLITIKEGDSTIPVSSAAELHKIVSRDQHVETSLHLGEDVGLP